jgi:hypothetical protein
MAIPFISSILGPPRQHRDIWFSVGPCSSFPNITSKTPLCTPLLRNSPNCKVFLIPYLNNSISEAVEIPLTETSTHVSGEKYEQVLVVQFQGKFHAMINVRLSCLVTFQAKRIRNVHMKHTLSQTALYLRSRISASSLVQGLRVRNMSGHLTYLLAKGIMETLGLQLGRLRLEGILMERTVARFG